MKFLKGLLSVLVTVGAVNWGLVGTRKFDLVARLFGNMSPSSRVIYSLVGLAGLYHILQVKNEVQSPLPMVEKSETLEILTVPS